jgi:hypothetical protein
MLGGGGGRRQVNETFSRPDKFNYRSSVYLLPLERNNNQNNELNMNEAGTENYRREILCWTKRLHPS